MSVGLVAAPLARLWDVARADLAAVRERIQPVPPPAPGLRSYRFSTPGGRTRLHLRVEKDGSGVLFRNVTDVVHLNATAAEQAWWGLEGVPRTLARARVRGRTEPADRPAALAALDRVLALVEAFAAPDGACPTCALDDLGRAPLFSQPVSAPYKADLALTYGCNNDCPHCYNESDRLRLASLPADGWRAVIDRLVGVGVPHLIFTGGEATLHPDLTELVRHAETAGAVCGLNTNGRRFARREYVQELVDAGLDHVQVTLGSHDPAVHDRMMNARSFAQTVAGIRNAVESELHCITNTTLTTLNARGVEDTVAFLQDLGIRTFAMNGMIHSGGGFRSEGAFREEELAPLLVRVRDAAGRRGMRFLWYTPTEYCRLSPVELEIGAKRCNAGEYSLCVEPNGDVLPCQSYYVTAGNVLRDPWDRIWRGELFRSFRERIADPVLGELPEKCHACPDLPLCGGGCRIEREAAAGIRVAESAGCAAGGCSAEAARPQGGEGFVALADVLPRGRRGTGTFR